MTNPPAPSDLPKARQRAVDALSEHFARDTLSLEEFERRIERAHKADSVSELEGLLQDLPTGRLPAVRPENPLPEGVARVGAAVPAERVRERDLVVAVCGASSRKGRWVPARNSFSVALMGGVELDFREALLGPGVTELNVFAVLGSVEILVPPGMFVECSGIAVLGGFEHTEDNPPDVDPAAPVLKIRGMALLGAVEVNVRYPGETARDARRRKRLARRTGGDRRAQ